MFDDDHNKRINPYLQGQQAQPKSLFDDGETKSQKALIVIAIIVVATIVAFLFYKYETRKNGYNPADLLQSNNAIEISKLPIEIKDEVSSSTESLITKENSSEKLTFGNFYKKQEFPYKQIDASYELPINIKSATTNYYDFSRKINLDQETIDRLNKNGFAIAKNTVAGDKRDFWNTYQKLVSLNVPIMITSDFLMYYFENNIKSIYKEIEKSVFYDNLWDINMAMYNKALVRYRTLASGNDAENNPLLESARLELSFFATGLKLLEPRNVQISGTKLIDENKFSPQEIKKYTFEIPDYLKNGTIEKEIAFINEANGEHRSPIFFYNKDYSTFRVPNAYRNNAKLYNFFLVTEWMRTEFPLYQQSAECPKCLLDYDDWKINLGAASFISDDLYKDLELKNKWAIVYKYISFFSGLRQDLTFLNYNAAFVKLFGENYNLENIFARENPNEQKDFASIQNELSNYAFSEIEGTYSRELKNRKNLGMRLLQDYFWPNDHIFDYLSGPELRKNKNNGAKLITECVTNRVVYRCNSFGLDIVNLLKPIDSGYSYFTSNTLEYSGYQERQNNIFQQIANFNTNAWNNNIYWMTLDMSRPILEQKSNTTYAKNPLWQTEKSYNTVLGSWVDIHLVGDEFVNYSNSTVIAESNLGGNSCNKYNIVEQDIEFINELISRGEMLSGLTDALDMSKNTNGVSIKLKKLTDELRKFREIEKAESEGVLVAEDDCRFIKTFVNNYSAKEGDANFFIVGQDGGSVRESNNGAKLLFVVNQDAEGKKTITAGPIFDYQESRLR
ncbi:DUF3160 domain-containing protein [Candidatus Parcubacteria bacterium]|nr:DUF3160 domain-containing protein [Patescibacteria group bacterium]MBU4309200.1 DUF3160 domain-containing protein [Patescibacteria group bacterium]MBU4432636.1 DUF3160 domain-containing protein [Patescibacteria group bacterium]MBU4577561.1 DUF3160 domain-containing protein [Patescibacteria group bacterium]MCG2697248.1 DUF3160 domain-containing protein [Candidatus Parcubacteria bacterium]